MSFKYYIRSLEGRVEVLDKPFHEKPSWFDLRRARYILDRNVSCIYWFTWCATPQGENYWAQFGGLKYNQLPPEPKEIIDSWIRQVNNEL